MEKTPSPWTSSFFEFEMPLVGFGASPAESFAGGEKFSVAAQRWNNSPPQYKTILSAVEASEDYSTHESTQIHTCAAKKGQDGHGPSGWGGRCCCSISCE